MATYWENSCSFGIRYVSWYKYLIVSLFFSDLGFWSGNLFLIAPFPDLCLLVPLFRDWVKAIDKYAVLLNAPDDRKQLMAFQSATGAVSGFIERYMNAHPHNTWDQLKRQLSTTFSDVTDPQFALSLLRKLKQKPGENIQVFAERILSLAEEAFVGQGGDMVERQLIETFVDGLSIENT